MKRLIFIIITVMLIGITVSANAADALSEDGNFRYRITDGKAWITSLTAEADEELVLPDYVEGVPLVGIADTSKQNKPHLKSITLSAGFTEPLPERFYVDTGEWAVAEGNSFYDTIDGVLVNKEHTVLYSYPAGRADTEYSIPEGISAVYECAFYSASLKKVYFPSTIRYIGKRSFVESQIESLNLPDGFVGIGDWAFYECESLKDIHLPDNMEYIGIYAFSGCGIEQLTLPASLDRAEEYAFSDNDSLRSVVIPESVKNVNKGCFASCHMLQAAFYNDNTNISEDAFRGCIHLILDDYTITASADCFAGGSGSREDPYLISNEDQLKNIDKDLTASYKLINDIELSDGYHCVISAGIMTENGNLPPVFSGSFDGNGHTISRLSFVSYTSENIGLFGYIRNAEIKNLNVLVKQGSSISVKFFSGEVNAGIICGYNDGGVIENCSAAGTVAAKSGTGAPPDKYRDASAVIGGIAGRNSGIIRGCKSVIGTRCNNVVLIREIGGVCGVNTGEVIGCGARLNRNITAVYNCIDNNGGITADNSGVIKDCAADGYMNIIVPGYYGVFGYSGARGESCQPKAAGIAPVNSGTISGSSYSGAVTIDFAEEYYRSRREFAQSDAEDLTDKHIQNCKDNWLFGVCRENSGTITDCGYSAEKSPEAAALPEYGTTAQNPDKAALDALEYSPRLHEIRVQLDGNDIDFDVQPCIIDGRTLVPVRGIFEALGMSVEWNGETKTVTAKSDTADITIVIGEKSFMSNGNVTVLDVPAQIIDNRTLVPVRAVAEGTGNSVEWIGSERLVRIKTE